MAITLTQSPVLKSLSTTVVVALFITASSTLTALSTQANAQDSMQVQVARGYPLGAGDILRLEFLNRPDIRLNIQVELTGYANFPFIGAVLVGGRTIEELRAELPVLLDGAVLREEVGNDLRSNKVDSSELILSVLTYRPVVVAGDVAEPGEVEFSVGMTARTAVFKAQGIGSIKNGSAESVNVFRTRAEISRAVTRHAVLNALVSRQETIGIDDIVLPPNSGLSLSNVVNRANADLQLEQAKLEQQRSREQMRVEAAAERITAIRARLENLRDAEAIENENVSRLTGLVQRKLVATGQLNEARRDFLETAEFRHRAIAEASRAELEWEELLVTSRIEDINRLQSWRTEMSEIDAELDVLMVALAAAWGQDATVKVYRQTPAGIVHMTLGIDDMLMPGDIIELSQTWVGQ